MRVKGLVSKPMSAEPTEGFVIRGDAKGRAQRFRRISRLADKGSPPGKGLKITTRINKRLILQTFIDDHVRQSIDQRDIGSWQ